ncbi:MAG: hypothetical protein FWH26_08975 [Oscillospiraceae bacterium]|nr:hypothetical protein [Oscillospiraceae bacterium]
MLKKVFMFSLAIIFAVGSFVFNGIRSWFVDPTPTTTVSAEESTEPPSEPPGPLFPDPQTFDISALIVQAFIDENPESFVEAQECVLTPSSGSDRTYIVDGAILIDLLEDLGADVAAINSASTLKVISSDGVFENYAYDMIVSEGTLMSLYYVNYNGSTANTDIPRLFPETGSNNMAVKEVASMVLTYA